MALARRSPGQQRWVLHVPVLLPKRRFSNCSDAPAGSKSLRITAVTQLEAFWFEAQASRSLSLAQHSSALAFQLKNKVKIMQGGKRHFTPTFHSLGPESITLLFLSQTSIACTFCQHQSMCTVVGGLVWLFFSVRSPLVLFINFQLPEAPLRVFVAKPNNPQIFLVWCLFGGTASSITELLSYMRH